MALHKEFLNFEDLILSMKTYDETNLIKYFEDTFKELSTKEGISNLMFADYLNIPMFISNKLFSIFDKDDDNFLNLSEFCEGFTSLYGCNYNELTKIIFDLCDFDHDHKIFKKDIKLILFYLSENTDQYQTMSTIHEILKQSFNKKNDYLSYSEFVDLIESKNSDIFIIILIFLFKRKPFTSEILKFYKVEGAKKNRLKNTLDKIKKLENTKLVIPSKNSILFITPNIYLNICKLNKPVVNEEEVEELEIFSDWTEEIPDEIEEKDKKAQTSIPFSLEFKINIGNRPENKIRRVSIFCLQNNYVNLKKQFPGSGTDSETKDMVYKYIMFLD